MRVLFDHQTFLLQRYGGISRYFYELITRLAALPDVDLDLFMGIHINGYGLEKHRERFRRFSGIRRPELPHLLTLSLLADRLLFSRFARRSAPDIYHPTYFYPLAHDLKAKRVVTVFDMIYELYPGDYLPEDVTAPNKKEAVRRGDAVVCISESTKRDLLRLIPMPEEKVSVTYLANSMTASADGPSLFDFPYLLFVGKRGGYKNFARLLEAYAHSSRLRGDFHLVCFGGGQFGPSEIERIKGVGMEGKVHYVAGPDETLARLYRHASLLVYPSMYEGFGVPLLEAMHYGCPVVVSNTSSMPEIVGEGGIYFDPNSEAELTAAMEKVLFSDAVRSGITDAGRGREALFSWDRCVRETCDLYRSLLNS